jgi:hypothetical protein
MNHKMNILENFFNNGTTKSLAITALVAIGGWTANTLIGAHSAEGVLAEHTRQLAALFQGQVETHKSINDLVVAVTAVDGKIDVLGTKIDDDRRTRGPVAVAKVVEPHRFNAAPPVPAEASADTTPVVPPK